MTPRDTANVLTYYMGRHIDRLGRMPTKRDLDPVLVNTLIGVAGSAEAAVRFLDAWFDSTDPWYARQSFALAASFPAMNRLFAQGDIEPVGDVTPQRVLARKLARLLFLTPDLRVVPPTKPS